MLQTHHPQPLHLHWQTRSNYHWHHQHQHHRRLRRPPSTSTTSTYITRVKMPCVIEPTMFNRGGLPSIKPITSPTTPTTTAAAGPEPKPFRLMDLPAEVRLKIYEAYLDTRHPHLDRARLVLIGERRSSFTCRSRYRALGLNPVWENGGGPRRQLTALFTLSRQIYIEAAHHFYTHFTFLFTGRVAPERACAFLASLSPAQRGCIQHVGFEVVFSVHHHHHHHHHHQPPEDEEGPDDDDEMAVLPKHPLALYREIPSALRGELQALRSVLLYLNPHGYTPCDRVGAENGVLQLAGFFAGMGKEVKFLPVLPSNRDIIERAEREMVTGGLREWVGAVVPGEECAEK